MNTGEKQRGELNWCAVLTPEKVLEIRDRRAKGEKLVVLALEYGVSEGSIGDVCNRRTWRHI